MISNQQDLLLTASTVRSRICIDRALYFIKLIHKLSLGFEGFKTPSILQFYGVLRDSKPHQSFDFF